jgi:hypothetical protein
MPWFSRKPVAVGTFRITGVTPADSAAQVVLNGMPQQLVHVSGIVQIDGSAPESLGIDQRFGMDALPRVGAVLTADVLTRDPLKVRVHWDAARDAQQVSATRNDAEAAVIQQLMTTGRADHAPGVADPVGLALTDPGASGTIAEQLAAALGTPLTMDVDEGGVKKRITVGGGGHLSSADAAQLEQSGTKATATITGATRVEVPPAMMPSLEASLWDLDLTVTRADGTSYEAKTRIGYRSEARRQVLGLPGTQIPVRIDPADDSRVALDSTTYDAEHPDAPPR